MKLNETMDVMLPDIEESLKELVKENIPAQYSGIQEMISYHFGWVSHEGATNTQGKRIRPLLFLLSAQLCNGEWQKALPAAAALEMLHNFSLVHDDIEDQSAYRRGKPTLWKLWGVPQAINTGDAMFSLAQIGMLQLGERISQNVAYECARIFNQTCLALTGGQHLDMKFESLAELNRDDYFTMITGKTSALISASTELGGVVAQTSRGNRNALRTYGEAVGIAFQVWDDMLGIWGNESKTGKSASSDLRDGKKTLPVIYALEQNPELMIKINQNDKTEEDIAVLVNAINQSGARKYSEGVATYYTNLAVKSLHSLTNVDAESLDQLLELTNMLIKREK